MDLDRTLLTALVEAIPRDIDQGFAHQLATAAVVLAFAPETALAWGQVLTEHTAPSESTGPTKSIQVYAMVEVHPYYDGGLTGQDTCERYQANLAARCGQPEDAPVHRVETLGEGERIVLEMVAAEPYEDLAEEPVFTTLMLLGLVCDCGDGLIGVTARGRAWLEAHADRAGGEPS